MLLAIILLIVAAVIVGVFWWLDDFLHTLDTLDDFDV